MDGIQNFDAAAHTRLMNVNLLAVIELTHLATPELEKTKGCVINVSSVCARNVVCTSLNYFITPEMEIPFNPVILHLACDNDVLQCKQSRVGCNY